MAKIIILCTFKSAKPSAISSRNPGNWIGCLSDLCDTLIERWLMLHVSGGDVHEEVRQDVDERTAGEDDRPAQDTVHRL